MHTAFRRVNRLENGHSENQKGDGITLIFNIRRQVLRKGGGWNWHRNVFNGVTSLGFCSLTVSLLYTSDIMTLVHYPLWLMYRN